VISPYEYRLVESFCGGTAAGAATVGDLGWANTGAGTTGIPNGEADAWGIRYIRTAAVGAERGLQLGAGSGTLMNGMFSTNNVVTWYARVRFPTVPDGTNDFYFCCGISDMVGSLGGTLKLDGSATGIVFEVDRAVSTTNWLFTVGDDSAVYTKVDTGVPFDTSYVHLMFTVDTAAGFIQAYINDKHVATFTGTMPGNTYARNIGCFYTSRSVGSTARDVYLDHWEFHQRRNVL
jgi:hypothetical protein